MEIIAMIRMFFVGYSNTQSENPNAVHAIIPPLEIETTEGEVISDDMIRKGIAARVGISVESVRLLCHQEYSK